MTKDFRDKWCAALRSGEYNQIQGSLHTSEGYCCLGVACELESGSGIWKPLRELDPEEYLVEKYKTNENEETALTNARLSRIGLSCDGMDTLADLNDQEGKSFAEIADWIEQNIPVEEPAV
jgi:hypothetical protein